MPHDSEAVIGMAWRTWFGSANFDAHHPAAERIPSVVIVLSDCPPKSGPQNLLEVMRWHPTTLVQELGIESNGL